MHNLVQAGADQKIDRRLVVDSLGQDPAAFRSNLALTTNRHAIADPEVTTNLNGNNEARCYLVLATAIDTGMIVPLKDFRLPFCLV